MYVVFQINYRTGKYQKLYISGSIPELGDGQPDKAREMEYAGEGNWRLSIETSAREISYQYRVIGNSETISEPWGRGHCVKIDSSPTICYLYDYWQHVPSDVALYTFAFTKSLFGRCISEVKSEVFERQLIIRVLCPRVEKHQSLFISGNCEALGHWNPMFARAMRCLNFPKWEIRLNIDTITFPLTYKFFIADETRQNCCWETGANRYLSTLPAEKHVVVHVSDYPFRDERPSWKGAGMVIPVFSLRSEQSVGIGDLHDLRLLIDWAKLTNQCLIQVLPMNDTTATHTWKDSYPYSAISIYALHPIYISLSDLGDLNNKKQAIVYRNRQKKLNSYDTVMYDDVLKHKIRYCRSYFEQEKEQLLQRETFQSFCRDNQSWLEPYAIFCFYRDKYKTADFTQWHKGTVYHPLLFKQLSEQSAIARREMTFTCFLQFVLHTQFKAVADYAREKGVILKGDLPIGISRTSVEAWMEPTYFNFEQQAGAPPDFFSATGQNWSFPTYNWEVMEQDGYSWWKKRFQKLSDYFNCLRIDHILGFFRIWEIPLDYVQGLCGHFRPAIPLSVDEIERFGFAFDKRYIKPRIHRRFLVELFGNQAEEVTEKYLTLESDGFATFLPFCDTQLKINQLFKEDKENPLFDSCLFIRDGLLKIANEVLFLEDPYESNTWHPRIMASQSYAFQGLTAKEQIAFQNLSNDFFYERHTEFWKYVALKRLTPLVDCTEMLICGEDLGMIPKSVQEVMDRLRMLSLELERAPKVSGVDFSNLQTVPYLSVCTTSTHDMETLRGWWEENPSKTQQYYSDVLHRTGESPQKCTPELAAQIIMNHLKASSMLTIIPLQDWFALNEKFQSSDTASERINIPENPHHYWRYRIPVSLEQLLQANELNQQIRKMIEHSDRA